MTLQETQASLAKSQTRLQEIKAGLERSQIYLNQFRDRMNGTKVSSSASIFNYASKLSDHEWLDVILKSIEHPVIDGIEMPGFPSDEIQRNSVGSVGQHNLMEAFNFYSEIKRYAIELGQPITENTSTLDFGCGWGRIIRFFLKDTPAENIYGIDVDQAMIDICSSTIRHGNYIKVNALPPAEIGDEKFHIIYAYSVFSHLAESVHIEWVEEFSRILKPGGVLFATTQSRSFIELCQSLRGKTHEFAWYNALANSFVDTEASLADYDNGKFLYSPTGGGETRDASFYGEAIIPPSYVKREWTKYFSFYDFVDDPSRCSQSIIVVQKPF
jgi:2-polyprenyl-3-methyl-5-hydroxy-6-metoxy-1,4-benzoquinol methylase